MLLLGSCGMIDGQRVGRLRAGSSSRSGRAVTDTPVKIGAPYSVGGITYTPADTKGYVATGYASWYGEELSGNRTANGEPFIPSGISAAHRTLPLPSYVEVTVLTTGRTILVRINDRGPFTQARELDLSRGAAEQLGVLGGGAVPIRMRRVEPPEAERAMLRAGKRVAERPVIGRPELAALRDADSAPPMVKATGGQRKSRLPEHGIYLVQIASFVAKSRAESLATRVGARAIWSGALWRVGFGPYTTASDARAGLNYAASKGFRDAIIMANDSEPAAAAP